MSEPRQTHPRCPICDVPMWLTRVEFGDIADKQQFECKVCDGKTRRIVWREQGA